MCTPLEHQGITRDIINKIMAASWRDSTKAQYNIYIKKWYQFCRENNINYYHADVTDVLKFISKL